MQQLGAVEAEVPLHREVAVVTRCLAPPLGRLEWTGGLRRGRGFFRRCATHLGVWRAAASGPDRYPKILKIMFNATLQSSFQVTDKGELEGEEDAFRDFSDIARNNQARIDS